MKRLVMQRILLAVCVAMSVVGIGVVTSPMAGAESPPSSAPLSYYVIDDSGTNFYDLGCDQGTADQSSGVNSVTVLYFFTQNSDHTGVEADFGMLSLTNSQVESLAEDFGEGYYDCTGTDTTTENFMSIATNNSVDSNLSTAGGEEWGDIVNAVSSYLDTNDGQVVTLGGDDIESFGYNSNESDTVDWISGYESTSGEPYYDTGSADDCSQTAHTNVSCDDGWNQHDYWYVSWGASLAFPVPEIYVSAQAAQWGEINAYAAAYESGDMTFTAPQSEYARNDTTLTADEAWNDLQSDTGQNGFAFNVRLSSGGA